MIRWSPSAVRDRIAIWEYVAEDDPGAATRLDEAFSAAVSRLDEFPTLGRPGLITGTRELFPVPNYRVVYELRDRETWILAVVHTSRAWPAEHDS